MERIPATDYSTTWFRDRAFRSIRKMGPNLFDFSDSALLYAPGAEETYEAIQQVDNPYRRLVTEPERAYLKTIASYVMAELPAHFDYIDLGPGTEHKEQFLFDAAKRQGKAFTYMPVDISQKFLEQSAEYAEKQNIAVNPIQTTFEELPALLGPSTLPRFVSLGLTYSNYNPAVILPLLKSIAGKNGYCLINSQMHNRVDMKELKKAYQEDVLGIAKAKLELIGLDFERDVATLETDNGIRAWCTLRNSSARLEALGVTPGSKLLLFQSLRSSVDELESNISAVFPDFKLFDTGGPFVGVLLKT